MTSEVYLAILLLLVGTVFIVLEVFIPSLGTLAVVAAGCLLGALYLAFSVGFLTGLAFLLAVMVMVPLAIRWAFKVLPRTWFGRRLLLAGPGKEVLGSGAYQRDTRLVGLEGTALTPLRPSGVAEIDGRRQDVLTEGSHVDTGRRVRVVEVKGNRILVRACEDTGTERKT